MFRLAGHLPPSPRAYGSPGIPKPTLTPLSSNGYLRRRLRGRISEPLQCPSSKSLMRAKAGDPPRTMPQKILAGRADDPLLGGDLVRLKVDQVVLCRGPYPAVAEAERLG